MYNAYFRAINIVMLVVWSLSLPPAVLFILRHGKAGRRFWITLMIFAISRILAAAFGLVTPSSGGPMWPADAFLNTMVDGLSTVYVVVLEILVVIINQLPPSHLAVPKLRNSARILGLLTFIGFILLCVGYGLLSNTEASQPTFHESSVSVAGSIVLDMVHVLLILLTVWVMIIVRRQADGRSWVLAAVLLAMAFLTGRLVYLGCEVTRNAAEFNPIHGNHTLFLCLAVLTEICSIIVIAIVGFAIYEANGKHGRVSDDCEIATIESTQLSGLQFGAKDAMGKEQGSNKWYTHLILYKLYRAVGDRG